MPGLVVWDKGISSWANNFLSLLAQWEEVLESHPLTKSSTVTKMSKK